MGHTNQFKVNQTLRMKNILKDNIHIFKRKYLKSIKTYIVFYSNNENDQDRETNKRESKDGSDEAEDRR